MGEYAFREAFNMKSIRIYMGWHAFLDRIQHDIHEGVHGFACISGGVQHEFHEDWHGLACISRGIQHGNH